MRRHSDSKNKSEEVHLVCGHNPALPNSVATNCSSCGRVVYGTRGSVLRAQLQQFPIICELCFDKLKDPQIAGVMHHGKMLTAAETQAFVENWFAKMARHGRN
jgi:hypothetical protein